MELQPHQEKTTSSTQAILRLELQMPTRLIKDYHNYTSIPDVSSSPNRIDRRWDNYSYDLYEKARSLYATLSSAEKEQLEALRDRKTQMFVRFARQYSPAIELLHESGLWGNNVIEKFDERGDISLRIISEHSLVVGKVAEVLAQSMVDKLVEEKVKREGGDQQAGEANRSIIQQQVVNEVVLGALLQDLNKRVEIDFKRLDQKSQMGRVKTLINEGFGREEDLEVIKKDPERAAGIFERLLQEKTVSLYKVKYKDKLIQYGNIGTIIACSKSAGMPVVSFSQASDGHYLPTLAQRIANYADKLVQDTGLVTNLERRHQVSASRYSPRELVDKEYEYAARCAGEFAQLVPGVKDGGEIPLFVLNTIATQIEQVA